MLPGCRSSLAVKPMRCIFTTRPIKLPMNISFQSEHMLWPYVGLLKALWKLTSYAFKSTSNLSINYLLPANDVRHHKQPYRYEYLG